MKGLVQLTLSDGGGDLYPDDDPSSPLIFFQELVSVLSFKISFYENIFSASERP